MSALQFHEDVTARLDEALTDLSALPFSPLSNAELETLLKTVTGMSDRLQHALGRVATAAGERELGDRVGASSTAHWWARKTRLKSSDTRKHLARSHHLEKPFFSPVADALSEGDLRTEQADVIIRAIDELPDDLEPAMLEKARDHMLDLATQFDADELRKLSKGLLEALDPERFENEEEKRLQKEEEEAAATARITIGNDGHGKVRGKFSIPEVHGELFRSFLMKFADPRRGDSGSDSGDDDDRPRNFSITPEKLGQAFMELIESFPADKLPSHAASTVAVTVTIDFDRLKQGLGTATLNNGHKISATEARRLACRAGMVPAVLDGKGEVLDLGRTRRLFSASQFKALALRDKGCSVEGCAMPSSICHAHHDDPWSRGGPTDLSNGRLLCPQHHRMVHNPRYDTKKLDDGKLKIVRRT
ncbi:DUF222 domain-containing protein [Nocardioides sp. JQ2195]|uniref:HNH endonuclease signature motif containing protein n=1 Tax=Nocardioides sp. JQ2195 TaxID=2592334 RepID=UPI00143E7712|nr:HNH endonuclease signature motif containing protein [Nocardioides sp. JQ2195]QIX27236.1 DUF222 domain-containing protein [Nocardioides sp. JQ2195]